MVAPSAGIEGGQPLNKFDLPITTQQVIRWTPDSRALTYIDTQAGVSNICGQLLDGGAPEQLTDFKSELIFWYDWSREGRQLFHGAFQRTVIFCVFKVCGLLCPSGV
jgi:hypothetical protein